MKSKRFIIAGIAFVATCLILFCPILKVTYNGESITVLGTEILQDINWESPMVTTVYFLLVLFFNVISIGVGFLNGKLGKWIPFVTMLAAITFTVISIVSIDSGDRWVEVTYTPEFYFIAFLDLVGAILALALPAEKAK